LLNVAVFARGHYVHHRRKFSQTATFNGPVSKSCRSFPFNECQGGLVSENIKPIVFRNKVRFETGYQEGYFDRKALDKQFEPS
jgi:hypothetical protein